MVCTSWDWLSGRRRDNVDGPPRRLDSRSSTRSMMTESAGQWAMSSRWQYSALVRGHRTELRSPASGTGVGVGGDQQLNGLEVSGVMRRRRLRLSVQVWL
ncbi:hypothetical protein BZL30_8880 [Mycobacterium kansasii]|uniref:Uncharacterized protein n=1 Tax=Mycobacterium kansasii TaxID=1768 RepID=A0A1V3WET6_MYCKA|nr:hypothetical protein BZL30_8880 [Mycobacterium kansasii]